MAGKVSQIWYSFCPVECASHIAWEKGFYNQEFGEDVKLLHITTLPVEDWQAHFTHHYFPLVRDGGNTPPIWTRSEGADTLVIGMVWDKSGQAILVRKDSPISSVTELKGKRIPLTRRLGNLIDFPRAIEKRAVVTSLELHGLTQDDVRWVDIPLRAANIPTEKPSSGTYENVPVTSSKLSGGKLPQQPEVDALERGQVDTVFAYRGAEYVLEQAGVGKVIYSLSDPLELKHRADHFHPYVCTVNARLAREHPDLIMRWMKALVKAGIWAKDNYAEVVSIMSRATNIAEEAFKKSHASDFHKHLVPEVSDKGIEALEIWKGFLREHGFISNDFDVKSWVDGTYLEAARKEAGR